MCMASTIPHDLEGPNDRELEVGHRRVTAAGLGQTFPVSRSHHSCKMSLNLVVPLHFQKPY